MKDNSQDPKPQFSPPSELLLDGVPVKQKRIKWLYGLFIGLLCWAVLSVYLIGVGPKRFKQQVAEVVVDLKVGWMGLWEVLTPDAGSPIFYEEEDSPPVVFVPFDNKGFEAVNSTVDASFSVVVSAVSELASQSADHNKRYEDLSSKLTAQGQLSRQRYQELSSELASQSADHNKRYEDLSSKLTAQGQLSRQRYQELSSELASQSADHNKRYEDLSSELLQGLEQVSKNLTANVDVLANKLEVRLKSESDKLKSESDKTADQLAQGMQAFEKRLAPVENAYSKFGGLSDRLSSIEDFQSRMAIQYKVDQGASSEIVLDFLHRQAKVAMEHENYRLVLTHLLSMQRWLSMFSDLEKNKRYAGLVVALEHDVSLANRILSAFDWASLAQAVNALLDDVILFGFDERAIQSDKVFLGGLVTLRKNSDSLKDEKKGIWELRQLLRNLLWSIETKQVRSYKGIMIQINRLLVTHSFGSLHDDLFNQLNEPLSHLVNWLLLETKL